MANITDITPDDMSADREIVLSQINKLAHSSEVNDLSDNGHVHDMNEVNDLFDSMTRFADIGHSHTTDEFPVLTKITNNFAMVKHLHDRQSIQILQYEIDQTQTKIDVLQKAISDSIGIVEQLLKIK